MSYVGENLRRIRRALGRTQDDIGRALGHPDGRYIGKVEQGVKHPGPDMLARIAGELGCSAEELKQRPPGRLYPFNDPGYRSR